MIRAVIFMLLLAGPAMAVQPGEMLDDPLLEARARTISSGLRCPVCRNESIDESNASLSAELRIVLRERLVAGDTDAQIIDYMVARYGEYVMLRPDTTGANLILWLAAPVMLLLGLGVGVVSVRRRQNTATFPLSDAEQSDLEKIIRQ